MNPKTPPRRLQGGAFEFCHINGFTAFCTVAAFRHNLHVGFLGALRRLRGLHASAYVERCLCEGHLAWRVARHSYPEWRCLGAHLMQCTLLAHTASRCMAAHAEPCERGPCCTDRRKSLGV